MLTTHNLDFVLCVLIQQNLKDKFSEKIENNEYSVRDIPLYIITKFQIQGCTKKRLILFLLFALCISPVLYFLFYCHVGMCHVVK